MSGRRHAGAVAGDGDESSADEITSMVTRAPDRNYHTTSAPSAVTAGSGMGAVAASAAGRRPAPSTLLNLARSTSRAEEGPTGPAGPAAGSVALPSARAGIQRFLSQFQSIELENKGSVARDHLAIERTFLAWLRTSLAFASIGIAVTQLFRLNTTLSQTPAADPGTPGGTTGDSDKTLRQLGKPLGATFLAISILVLLLGYHRYVESQRWVMEGKFPASRGTVILVSTVAFALMVASLVVVVVVHPDGTER